MFFCSVINNSENAMHETLIFPGVQFPGFIRSIMGTLLLTVDLRIYCTLNLVPSIFSGLENAAHHSFAAEVEQQLQNLAASAHQQSASLMPEMENVLANLERMPRLSQLQAASQMQSATLTTADLLSALLQQQQQQQSQQSQQMLQSAAGAGPGTGDLRALLQTPGKPVPASASVSSTPMKRSDCEGGGARGSAPATPIRSTVRRAKVAFHCRFGEFGVLDGQFTEPSGVAVCNATGHIFVADTNNHRIQMFDAEGSLDPNYEYFVASY